MTQLGTQSPADSAFERFRAHLASNQLFRLDDALLSEADTRSKLIDPVFKNVLGWNEPEIRRESPVAQGYVDYVLGSDYSYLLIEAKRSRPRFTLHAPGKNRRLKLDGPHLLANRKIKAFIEQAQEYAADIGVQFCLVTNGSQFIIFRPYLPGRPWRHGTVIVFHDHHDIETNFAEFYSLLARDSVVSGSLIEAFEHLERTTTERRAVLDILPDRDKELVRNRVWPAGAYYWRYFVRSFAYIDLVFVDTPLADHIVVRHLEKLADTTDIITRIERVRTFLEYLAKREQEELQVSAERGGPFQEFLMPQIMAKIEAEMGLIRKKLGIHDSRAS